MHKIKQSHWLSLTPSQKTTLYFTTVGYSIVDQSRWWNDWRTAFDWFADNYVKNGC